MCVHFKFLRTFAFINHPSKINDWAQCISHKTGICTIPVPCTKLMYKLVQSSLSSLQVNNIQNLLNLQYNQVCHWILVLMLDPYWKVGLYTPMHQYPFQGREKERNHYVRVGVNHPAKRIRGGFCAHNKYYCTTYYCCIIQSHKYCYN